MKNAAFLLLCLTTLLFACKKDSTSNQSSLLSSADCWALTKVEFFDSTSLAWEPFSLDDCLTENCWRYHEDGTLTFNNGTQKCDPSEPQTATGTWAVSTDGKTLELTLQGYGSESHEILELTEDKLVTLDKVSDFGPYNLVRDTYKPK